MTRVTGGRRLEGTLAPGEMLRSHCVKDQVPVQRLEGTPAPGEMLRSHGAWARVEGRFPGGFSALELPAVRPP